MNQKFYITTAIPYLNAKAHLGHVLEYIQADALARYHRQSIGQDNVWFLTGSDEHGTKIARAAEVAGKSPQAFVDELAGTYQELLQQLNISNNDFIRTSDRQRHWPAVQEIWKALQVSGDLYKKEYEGLYCVGHESFIKKTELIDGLCPLHKREPELVKEENWFFKLAKYKDLIREKIDKDELKIVPSARKSEILNLLDDAEDISVSRPIKTLQWGMPVPGDPTQTLWVWIDALPNYISALGYSGNDDKFQKFWPADVHLIGKDILRFHAIYWPAFLLSAGLTLPKAIFVHGFITVNGEKMSKTVGNVADPVELVSGYGSEVVRYFLLREIPSGDDGDFSYENLKNRYNSDLANGLGNLVQRTVTLIQTKLDGTAVYRKEWDSGEPVLAKVLDDVDFHQAIAQFRLHDALGQIWHKVDSANAYINEREPWRQEGRAQQTTLGVVATMIGHIAWLLQPFLPVTSDRIAARLGIPLAPWPDGQLIRVIEDKPLFPRRP